MDAFLTATRSGDFQALLALLDPDVVLRSDRSAVQSGAPEEVHGAVAVARYLAACDHAGRALPGHLRRMLFIW
jgi:RNA polymerase sigma-70 factor (ECF subfamily)